MACTPSLFTFPSAHFPAVKCDSNALMRSFRKFRLQTPTRRRPMYSISIYLLLSSLAPSLPLHPHRSLYIESKGQPRPLFILSIDSGRDDDGAASYFTSAADKFIASVRVSDLLRVGLLRSHKPLQAVRVV